MKGTKYDPRYDPFFGGHHIFLYLIFISGIAVPAVNLSTDRHELCRRDISVGFEKGLCRFVVNNIMYIFYTKYVYKQMNKKKISENEKCYKTSASIFFLLIEKNHVLNC